MPSIAVTISDGPLAHRAFDGGQHSAGALTVFEGLVRPTEHDQPISGLFYKTYDPMAERILEKLAHAAADRFGVVSVHAWHSRGYVANGECSFRIAVASAHRRECIDAVDWFIEQMKQDAPIWKEPRFVSQQPDGGLAQSETSSS